MSEAVVVGRYALYDEIAAGGMASVHLGRFSGPGGFARTVAVKRLHPQYAKDPEFVSMFLDEARLAARIRHPNVASTIDVVARDGELFLVMEYVHGESLFRLLRAVRDAGERIPVPITLSILIDALYGLHAAHEAKDELGAALGIVHRDVSPHNVMVGQDGAARVLDFGIAKAASRMQTTREGHLKGKLAYMSPEQLTRAPVDRRADVFAASIVLWEALTGERLFAADDQGEIFARVLTHPIEPPSTYTSDIPSSLDAVVLRGLARQASERFATAREMASALESAMTPARTARVGEWVMQIAGGVLQRRAERLAEIEGGSSRSVHPSAMRSEQGSDAGGMTAATMIVGDESSDARSPAHGDGVASRASNAPAPAPRRSTIRNASFALLGVVVVAGALFAPRLRGLPAPTAAPVVPSLPSMQRAVDSVATASAPPPVSAASSSSSTSTPTLPPASTGRPGGSRARPKSDCDPPYFFDRNGVKRFKPGCV